MDIYLHQSLFLKGIRIKWLTKFQMLYLISSWLTMTILIVP